MLKRLYKNSRAGKKALTDVYIKSFTQLEWNFIIAGTRGQVETTEK